MIYLVNETPISILALQLPAILLLQSSKTWTIIILITLSCLTIIAWGTVLSFFIISALNVSFHALFIVSITLLSLGIISSISLLKFILSLFSVRNRGAKHYLAVISEERREMPATWFSFFGAQNRIDQPFTTGKKILEAASPFKKAFSPRSMKKWARKIEVENYFFIHKNSGKISEKKIKFFKNEISDQEFEAEIEASIGFEVCAPLKSEFCASKRNFL